MAVFASSQISARVVLSTKVAPRTRLVRFTATITAQGGKTNTIGARALGFSKILDVSNLLDLTADVVIPTATDGTNIYLSAFSTDKYAIGDLTITGAQINVLGIPL